MPQTENSITLEIKSTVRQLIRVNHARSSDAINVTPPTTASVSDVSQAISTRKITAVSNPISEDLPLSQEKTDVDDMTLTIKAALTVLPKNTTLLQQLYEDIQSKNTKITIEQAQLFYNRISYDSQGDDVASYTYLSQLITLSAPLVTHPGLTHVKHKLVDLVLNFGVKEMRALCDVFKDQPHFNTYLYTLILSLPLDTQHLYRHVKLLTESLVPIPTDLDLYSLYFRIFRNIIITTEQIPVFNFLFKQGLPLTNNSADLKKKPLFICDVDIDECILQEKASRFKLNILLDFLKIVDEQSLLRLSDENFSKTIMTLQALCPPIEAFGEHKDQVAAIMQCATRRFNHAADYGTGLFAKAGFSRKEKLISMMKLLVHLTYTGVNTHTLTTRQIKCLTQYRSETSKLMKTIFPNIKQKTLKQQLMGEKPKNTPF